MNQINCPDNFKLYYSIYHPIMLMTSRQCLFQQVTGCEKHIIDDSCIQNCEKSASITNLKKHRFFIEKTKGHFPKIYNEVNFLNTEILSDIPDMFSSFFIDLCDIKTETKIELDKSAIIALFENLLKAVSNSKNHTKQLVKELRQIIHPTTNSQYRKGI